MSTSWLCPLGPSGARSNYVHFQGYAILVPLGSADSNWGMPANYRSLPGLGKARAANGCCVHYHASRLSAMAQRVADMRPGSSLADDALGARFLPRPCPHSAAES